MNYLEQLKSYIDENEFTDETFFISMGGVSQDSIRMAEKSLAVNFTNEYRKFLEQCGNVNIADQCISGLYTESDNEASTGSVVADTKLYRKQHSLPQEYIVVHCYVDGGESVLVQKSDKRDTSDSPIYYVDFYQDAPLKFQKQYDSFAQYFQEFLEDNAGMM